MGYLVKRTENKIVIPTMNSDHLQLAKRAGEYLMTTPPVQMTTSHVIHGGMYLRTIVIPAGIAVVGVMIKIPTTVIINGKITFYVGDSTIEIDGYEIIPARAGRQQIVVAIEDTSVTMVFPTEATTVEEAEMEFTDEWTELFSRNDENEINITGE